MAYLNDIYLPCKTLINKITNNVVVTQITGFTNIQDLCVMPNEDLWVADISYLRRVSNNDIVESISVSGCYSVICSKEGTLLFMQKESSGSYSELWERKNGTNTKIATVASGPYWQIYKWRVLANGNILMNYMDANTSFHTRVYNPYTKDYVTSDILSEQVYQISAAPDGSAYLSRRLVAKMSSDYTLNYMSSTGTCYSPLFQSRGITAIESSTKTARLLSPNDSVISTINNVGSGAYASTQIKDGTIYFWEESGSVFSLNWDTETVTEHSLGLGGLVNLGRQTDVTGMAWYSLFGASPSYHQAMTGGM